MLANTSYITSAGKHIRYHKSWQAFQIPQVLAKTSDITSDSQLSRAEVLRDFRSRLSMGRPKTPQPELQNSEEKKWPTFHTPRSRTICVPQDKHRYCLEGSFKGVGGRALPRDGAERVWAFPDSTMSSLEETGKRTSDCFTGVIWCLHKGEDGPVTTPGIAPVTQHFPTAVR